MKRLFFVITMMLFIWINSTSAAQNSSDTQFEVALSNDGTQIAYSVNGEAKTALFFIHGWSLDSRLWHNQIEYFSPHFKVVTVDLASHGNSSFNRKDHTMTSFAHDIKAVIERENINTAILVGHSMAGAVVAEAAKLMPEEVVGIIGIDTSQNVALKVSPEELDLMAKPFEDNFQKAMRGFVKSALLPNVDKDLLYWIQEDMASAPKEIAINQFRNYLGQNVSGESYRVYEGINVPVVLLNARLWPTNSEENKKYIKNYRIYFIEETGHFPMLEKPIEFNKLLLKIARTVE